MEDSRPDAMVRFRAEETSTMKVGWMAGAGEHPTNTHQVVLAAKRESDGQMFCFILGVIDIIRPYTTGELRAMIVVEWGKQDPEIPEVVRLIAAEEVIHRYR